nr:uncharacterized protein LOC118059987 isoform X2 [Populus alba]
MRSIQLGFPVSPTSINNNLLNFNFKKQSFFPPSTRVSHHQYSLPTTGLCSRASQVVELFPTVSPGIVVREARLEDSWEVAETHCSSFFPDYSFPLHFVLRVDRLVAMLSGFTIPNGCRRTCLVAVIGSTGDQTFYIGSEDFKFGGSDGNFSLNRGYIAGILTVDTVADFLPRKGPLRQRSYQRELTTEKLLFINLYFGWIVSGRNTFWKICVDQSMLMLKQDIIKKVSPNTNALINKEVIVYILNVLLFHTCT